MKPPTSRWQALLSRMSPRERAAVVLAAWIVGLGALWGLGIAPAWQTLARAPARHQAVDTQLARMQALAAQVEDIRRSSAGDLPARDAALDVLHRTARELGPGSVMLSGDQASLRIHGVAPDVLARALDQLRRSARVNVVHAELKRRGDGWSGSVTLAGPGLGD
ncbi:MAG: type II secretion system protein GspM [Hydrogenophaga sp.]